MGSYEDGAVKLEGKVSLITGASGGIGKAIALTFAKAGSDVIVHYVQNRDMAEKIVNEIIEMGRKAITVQADVASKDEVVKMVDGAIKEFGKIDILVNNAGVMWRTPNILEASRDAWEKVLGVNLLGTYYCIQVVAPYMIKQRYGKVINISSISGIGTTAKAEVPYATSKAAVNTLTKKLAYELGPSHINVNAIAPGLIYPGMSAKGRSKEELTKILEESANSAALRRIGVPQDIANVALFLASDESSFITGQVIVVDGGRGTFLSHSV